MSNKLLLQDLVDLLSKSGKLKKKGSEEFLRIFFKVIEDSLFQGEVVKIQGFGTFKLLKVDARKSVNVTTGEEFEINEHFKVSFIPDATLKELINKPYAHLEPVDLDLLAEKNESVVSDISENKLEENKLDDNIAKTKSKTIDKVNKEIDLPKKNLEHETILSKDDSEVYALEDSDDKNIFRPKIIAASFLLMILALAVWAFLSNRAAQKELKCKVAEIGKYESEQRNRTQADKSATLIEDSLGAEATTFAIKDSVAKAKKETKKKDPAISEIKAPKKYSSVLAQKFPVTETIEQGSRLTLLALKYYGNKAFWVYIYEANKNIITNPDKIPVGTKIRIPKPDFTKINAKDPESIAKAKAIQAKLFSK